MKSVITLTTDFGTCDGFVGQVKGVILSINPNVNLLDITHDIDPFSIVGGALALKGVVGRFAFPCIHMAVVDPGVGGKHRRLAIRLGDSYLVGPDNGLFSLILRDFGAFEARSIENPNFMALHVSNTFHGRDIFAPAAARLSLGEKFAEIGPMVNDLMELETPSPVFSDRQTLGIILHIDRFGNLVSNINRKHVEGFQLEIKCGPIKISGLVNCYSQSNPEEPVALINSFDLLEIALPMGNASEAYGVGVGTAIKITMERK